MLAARPAARLARLHSLRGTTSLGSLRATSAPHAMATRGSYTYEWPRPGLTVDVAVVSPVGPSSTPAASTTTTPHLLLIQRAHPPGAGRYALPGGFVEPDEDLDVAAARELKEETTLVARVVGGGGEGGKGAAAATPTLRQVRAFGGPDRDPRGWCVTVAYAAVLADPPPPVRGEDDAAEAAWWPVTALPDLAFDHARIVSAVLRSVAGVEAKDGGGSFGREYAAALVAGAAELEARPWVPTRE